MRNFQFRRWAIPLGLAVLIVLAWQSQGWAGVALVGGGVLMWGLLHFTRMTTVLKRAADQPVGWVGSAVMLNAKLKRGVNLLHVLALTRALGERLSAEGAEPEVYRWTDNGGVSVTCTFAAGRLQHWTLERPPGT
ncbi:MAG TPA: glycerate kinase [Burkholderiaceae bacterium]|nr:glycerate kinase [Burkholderiaceae bacterium]